MNLPEIIIAFMGVKGLGRKTIQKVISQMKDITTQKEAYLLLSDLCSRYKRIEPISEKTFECLLVQAKKCLDKQAKDGVQAIVQGNELYPLSFYELDDPPILFYAKGNVQALKLPGVAIVGTRNVSPNGKIMGEHIGKFVSETGLTVISGLAAGCDSAGHEGCLQASGITIAIVATPLNQVYPASNIDLAKKIMNNNGCFISEYAYDEPLSTYNFVARDRLQCGLAKGVIVIETGVRGGTMHAVNGAFKMGKPVGCFSFKDDHYDCFEQSRGNKLLIQSGKVDELYNYKSMNEFLKKCNEGIDGTNIVMEETTLDFSHGQD